jgi:hypothetical protein
MKGYFGQLARHTGLRFADSRASRMRPGAPVAPLHVEEVAMVSQPIAEVASKDEPPAVQAAVVQNVETPPQPKVDQPLARDNQIVPISEEPPPEKAESVQSVVIEQSTILAADNTEIKHDPIGARIEPIEVSVPFHSFPEQKVETETPHEATEVEITDPVEREVLVRQYLREVRAWVAASPMPDDETVFESRSIDKQPETVAFTVERDSIPTAQPDQRDQIDVHDMNLSIGNISIVIEEPQPLAAAVIAPTPSAPPPQPQTRPEPTSLSRYYLRSW